MCGIVGYIGRRDSVPILLEGLQRLEYRGYDSAGIAVIKNDALRVHKAKGKVRDLADSLPKRVTGSPGIAHTRWATHGEPSDTNSHPHVDNENRVAIVHNGIIENAADLRQRLIADGASLVSETDSEVLAHMIARTEADDLEAAVRTVLKAVEGAYGLAVIDVRFPDRIVVARNGSPVVLGVGEREMFVASDVSAIVRYTQQMIYLDDGELATVTADSYRTSTLDARTTTKTAATIDWGADEHDKGGYGHFLRKEIHEQPEVVERTLRGRLDERFATARLGGIDLDPRELLGIRRIKILACGSAYYSGLAGAQLIEGLTRIPADAEPASEFRYRNPVIEPDTLYIAASQSGETFDTLRAVEEVTRKGGRVLGVINVVGSSIARACQGGVYLHAGPEVSVASTKAFSCTLAAFALLALRLGRVRDVGPADGARWLDGLKALPGQIDEVLAGEDHIATLAAKYAEVKSAFFIGRVRGYPIALEGAQKLKEISYIHAEAYPASELKHGPLALITPEVPSFVLVPDDELFEKNVSAIEQIKARGGPVIAIAHRDLSGLADDVIVVPKNEDELDPLLMNIPLQLFAYHAAVALGRDVDQPRNLAKSVTVE